MRLLDPDGRVLHLSYCTNVHPAEDLDGVIAQFDEYALPILIDRPEFAKMPREMSFADEVGEHCLVDDGSHAADDRARRCECAGEIARGDEIRNPKRRRERLAECAEVDHSRGIKSAKGTHRCTGEAKLAVVVILDDEQIVPPGVI